MGTLYWISAGSAVTSTPVRRENGSNAWTSVSLRVSGSMIFNAAAYTAPSLAMTSCRSTSTAVPAGARTSSGAGGPPAVEPRSAVEASASRNRSAPGSAMATSSLTCSPATDTTMRLRSRSTFGSDSPAADSRLRMTCMALSTVDLSYPVAVSTIVVRPDSWCSRPPVNSQ